MLSSMKPVVNSPLRNLPIRHKMWRATFDGGNLHVRFDERREETERCRMAQATAPLFDSTRNTPNGCGCRPAKMPTSTWAGSCQERTFPDLSLVRPACSPDAR